MTHERHCGGRRPRDRDLILENDLSLKAKPLRVVGSRTRPSSDATLATGADGR